MKPGPRTEPFLDALRARTLSLDDLTFEMAKALSHDGTASRGIRAAVRFAYDCYQADRFNPSTTSGVPVVPGMPGSPSGLAALAPAQAPESPVLPDESR